MTSGQSLCRCPGGRNNVPPTPGHRDDDTSEDAATTISSRVDTLRLRVLEAFRNRGPMTPDEAAEVLGEGILAIRPRCTELKRLGCLRKTGNRRQNRTGGEANELEISQTTQENATC